MRPAWDKNGDYYVVENDENCCQSVFIQRKEKKRRFVFVANLLKYAQLNGETCI
jgi:hypothetical protein